MKTIITSILFFALVHQVSAKDFYEQLCEFNPNWSKYESRVPQRKAAQFPSERVYIQAHLTTVLSILRSNPTDDLSTSQLSSRNHLIAVLNDYRIEGRFPINYYRNERIPVFIDEHNTHCAVGFLLQETGFDFLANEISRADNYVWVKDITDTRVIDWQEMSGFTLEELKIIQGAYDSYMPNAFIAPNRYEIPQKPACNIVYFEDEQTGKELAHTAENVWFFGEGKSGVLNGRWEQNYAVGIPWIVGYYKNGKRTGQWKEYYQGTDKLCRTENWRDDKLNGVRIRFDKSGEIIEEIMFKDGNAVTKTNYDRAHGIKSVRTPLDSVMLYNETYTMEGRLLATGVERVHNPGNLLWFQNIELTALNSVAITARSVSEDNGIYLDGGMNGRMGRPMTRNLFQTPPLVQYKKEGKWTYYRDADQTLAVQTKDYSLFSRVDQDFQHFSTELKNTTLKLMSITMKSQIDSLVVHYESNLIYDFIGYGEQEFKHIHFAYYADNSFTSEVDNFYQMNSYRHQFIIEPQPRLKEMGEYNANGYRIGEWKHFDVNQQLYSVEKYLIPKKEESLVLKQN